MIPIHSFILAWPLSFTHSSSTSSTSSPHRGRTHPHLSASLMPWNTSCRFHPVGRRPSGTHACQGRRMGLSQEQGRTHHFMLLGMMMKMTMMSRLVDDSTASVFIDFMHDHSELCALLPVSFARCRAQRLSIRRNDRRPELKS